MNPYHNELFEDWCFRARMYEHGIAMQRIAQGEDPGLVLEEMSKRLLAKMLHPIYKILEDEVIENYNPIKSQDEYKDAYFKKYSRVADHVIKDE